MHPLADYAYKELGYRKVITVANDLAFGYEETGGFERVFEDAGGRVKAKLRPPLVTPDHTLFIGQMSDADAGGFRSGRLESSQVHAAGQGSGHDAAGDRRQRGDGRRPAEEFR